MINDIAGNIGEFIVSNEALNKFLRLNEQLEFWHLCQKEEVKALYENESGIIAGYAFADFLAKLSQEISGELVIARMKGTCASNIMLKNHSEPMGMLCRLNLKPPSMHELDKKKLAFIIAEFKKDGLIREWLEKYNDMPPVMDAGMTDMEFISDYWNDAAFRKYANSMFPNKYSDMAVKAGDDFLLNHADEIRRMFESEPITAKDIKIKELYATPNTRKWFIHNLPHFRIAYINPKQFSLLG